MTVDQGSSVGTSNDAQAAAVSALQAGANGGGNGQAPAQQQGQAPAASAQGQDTGLATPFLEAVDPADRPVVEKYIKDWDAGVNKRFQELHGKLQPWEQLGADPEQAAQAMQLLQMIDTEPERVLSLLQEAIGQQGDGDPQGQQGQQQGAPPDGEDPLASLPPAFVEQFTQMQQVLEMLAGDHLSQREQRTQAEEDKQLDQTLATLKEQHGEFDERYVLALMMAGEEPEAAVKAFQQAVQGQVNARSQTPPVPAILGGGGAAPQERQDITKASSKDVRGLVANILRQQAQQ